MLIQPGRKQLGLMEEKYTDFFKLLSKSRYHIRAIQLMPKKIFEENIAQQNNIKPLIYKPLCKIIVSAERANT